MRPGHILASIFLVARCATIESSKLPGRKHKVIFGRPLPFLVLNKDISSIAHSKSSLIVNRGGSGNVPISGITELAENELNHTNVNIAKSDEVVSEAHEKGYETDAKFDSDHAVIEENSDRRKVVADSTLSKSGKKGIFRRKDKKHVSAASIGKKLKNRNSMNIKRKLVHFGFGALFATLNHVLPRKVFMPFMYCVNTAAVFVETFRYRKGFEYLNDLMLAILGSAVRKHEMEGKFTGSLYYFSGVTLSAYLYPKTATTLGIFQLAIADPTASYFGRLTRHVYWSRIENGFFGIGRNKGILGFAGGALVCFPFNYRVLSVAKWGANGAAGGKRAIILASLALGAAGSLADLAVPTPAVTLPSKRFPLSIDDNFVVPVISGFACMHIFNYLKWSHDLELAKYIVF